MDLNYSKIDYSQPGSIYPQIDNSQQHITALHPGLEPILRLVEQQFREQLQPIHAEIRSLQEQITLLKRGQRSRKKSQLTEEERESCLDVYQICLRAVKQSLADLPIVRGNPDASTRVDQLVDDLYNSYDEVRKAVDCDPPILTKNDIRLHVLNVMAEQRRKRKTSDVISSPNKRKRLDQSDEEDDEDDGALPHEFVSSIHHQQNANSLLHQNIEIMHNSSHHDQNRGISHVYNS